MGTWYDFPAAQRRAQGLLDAFKPYTMFPAGRFNLTVADHSDGDSRMATVFTPALGLSAVIGNQAGHQVIVYNLAEETAEHANSNFLRQGFVPVEQTGR